MPGKISWDRGYRAERDAVKALARFGFQRVPRSGADPNNPGDLIRKASVLDGKVLYLMESKRRTGGWATFETWLKDAQFLRLEPGGRRRAWYALPEDIMLRLLEEAGYGH
jgi:hypothetical protein